MPQNKENPWKGLSSYKEEDQKVFLGRGRFINDLYVATINNLFVTLYGKTGSGKTSLLQAGIFPQLRNEGYLPVLIRLSLCPESFSFAQFIVSQIESHCRRNRISVELRKVTPTVNQDHGRGNNFLWHYLYSHDFINSYGQHVFPVIIIDQMEEGFYNMHEDTCVLLRQLFYLVSDELLLPEGSYSNFRVIIAIREDYLFLLEDAIEDGGFHILKQNRYRLTSLKPEEAKEVVEIGQKYMEEGKETNIVSRIIALSKDEMGHISTNILSLICSQLFYQNNGYITEKMIDDLDSTTLMEHFYMDCIKHVSETTREFIEKEMVDLNDGHRRIVRKSDFRNTKKGVSTKDAETLLDGEYKIVQISSVGGTQCYELIHDSLASAIKKIKDEEQKQSLRISELERIKQENSKLKEENNKIRKALWELWWHVEVHQNS